ncbi:hypothetical protein N7493_007271 [Penicillium malachiteum]|uniref:Uncharacterized protein n=1 Tax=Penicillium malachiteum TaxID=1324776 RepID=A0AAD6MUM8_9EURO|nr:hypothetical protein N7493_007271 [Penicillium malachiteum]
MPNTDPNVSKLSTVYQQFSFVLYLRRINTVKSVEAQQRHLLHCESLLPAQLSARCFDFRIAALEAQARLGQHKELWDTRRSLFVSIHEAVYNKTVLPLNLLIGTMDSFWLHGIFDLSIFPIFGYVKLLLDVMRLDVARKALISKFPERILDTILSDIPQSPLVTANPKMMNSKDLTSEITRLANDLDILIDDARSKNPHFWEELALHNPSDVLHDWPSKQEALDLMTARGHEMLLWHVFYWFETPGAIPLLRRKLGL